MGNRPPSRNSLLAALPLAVVIFAAWLALLEIIARTPWAEKALPDRSVGEYNYTFEIKWYGLQKFVEQSGGVDVIVLGNSMVNTGIDPEVISRTYQRETGVHLRIYNFGVDGLTVAPTSVLAGILAAQYRPALLVFVTDMRDYYAGNGLGTELPFLADPWMRYRSGAFNPVGWTIDHSAALQEFLPFRDWTRADFFGTFSHIRFRFADTRASGYEPDHHVGQGIDLPPDPNNPADAKNFTAYQNYEIALSRLLNLESILSLNRAGKPAVLVVEMPVHPTAFAFFGGEAMHQKFQQLIASDVKVSGGEFIPWDACSYIPLEGRSDRWHLNEKGAPIFSSCLGEQLAMGSMQQDSILFRLGMAGGQ
jgi:hypothetical protein